MNAVPASCHACGKGDFAEVIDLGRLPVAHRLLRPGDDPAREYRHGLALHACRECGLLQILDPIPPEELYRDYNFCFTSWKPQPHMTDETALLRSLAPGQGALLEIGCNDGTFLRELAGAGLGPLVGVEPNRSSAAVARTAAKGLTVYEEFFDERLAGKLTAKHGRFRAVAMRQVLEHVPDLRGTLRAIRGALGPGGMFLVEVPDFEGPLAAGDASALWEEHVNYFTEPVLMGLLAVHGFDPVAVRRYPFSGGALMIAARAGPVAPAAEGPDPGAERALEAAASFDGRVARFRRNLVKLLEEGRRSGAVNVLYGAGCRATVAVNGLGVGELFDFAVDDQPEKQGLLMAGCRLEVRPSSALASGRIHCFLSVNHENEAKVMERHAALLGRGGRFHSLCFPSPLFHAVAGGKAP